MNFEAFYTSLLPENVFFLVELLFQMRALVGDRAFCFTLSHTWFITLRLRRSKWGNVCSKKYPVKETGVKHQAPVSPSFPSMPFQALKGPRHLNTKPVMDIVSCF